MNSKKLLSLTMAALFTAMLFLIPTAVQAQETATDTNPSTLTQSAPTDDQAPPVVQRSTWGAIKALYRGSSEQSQETPQAGVRKPGAQSSGIVYPGWYKELPVPWMPQVPPGDWDNTKNCGQACALMIDGYFRWYCPAQSAITSVNSWLATRFGDSRYYNANGWYTNFGTRNELGTLLRERLGRSYSVQYGSSYDDISRILSEIQAGKPVICGVMISGGNLVSSGGRSHWAIAVGYDQGKGEIILNDPGTDRGYRRGNKIHYKFSAFYASWVTQSRVFAPIW